MKQLNAISAALPLIVNLAAGPTFAQTPILPGPISRLTTAEPRTSCEQLKVNARLDDAAIITAQVKAGASGNDWCQVTVEVLPAGERNSVTVWVSLPLKNWNGRLLGLSGGGFLGGLPDGFMTTSTSAVASGFVAASTDAGHAFDLKDDPLSVALDGSFALDHDGRLNWDAVRNFA